MAAIDLPDLRGRLRMDLSELTRAPVQVRAAIARMQQQARGNPVRIPVELDDRTGGLTSGVRDGQRRAQAQADRDPVEIPLRIDRTTLEGLAQRVRDLRTVYSATLGPIQAVSREIAGFAVKAGAAATAITAGVGLSGGLLAFAAAAAQAAQAAPLAAAGLAAFGAASTVLKVGLSGVSDAIDKSLKKSFQDLAPAADRIVAGVTRLAPALLSVRNAIQQSLLSGLAEQIRPLAERYLPTLRTEGTRLAAVFNGSLRSAVADLNTTTNQWRIAAVLESARRSLSAFSPVVAGLPGLFLRVTEAASPAFTDLARSGAGALGVLEGAIGRAADSGALAAGIRQAVGVLTDLASVAGGVLGVFRGLNEAATAVFGTSLVGQVGALASQLARLVQSAPGQNFLRSLFETAVPVIRQVGQVLGELLPALRPLIPVLGQLATAFLTGLQPVIPVVSRLAVALGGALASVLPAVSTVAVALGSTLTAAVNTLAPVIPPLAAGLASLLSPTGVLTAAMSALAPVLPILADGLGGVVTVISGALVGALAAVTPVLPLLAQAFSDLANAVATQLASALIAITPQLPQIVGGLVALTNSLVPLIPAALQLAQPFLELAASVLPGLLSIVNALSGPLVFLGTVILGVVAAIRALKAIAAVSAAMQKLQFQLTAFGPAGNVASAALGRVRTALNIGGAALAGLATAGFLLKKLQDAAFGTAPGIEQTKTALLGLSDARIASQLPNLGQNLEYLGAQVQRLADPSLGDQASKLFTNIATIGQVNPGALRDAQQNLGSLDAALSSLVQSGNGQQAAAAFNQIAAAAERGGASVDQVRKVLPQYTDALAGVANQTTLAAGAAGRAAGPMSALEQQAHDLGVTFEQGASAGSLLNDAIGRLNGNSLSALDTDISYRESLDGVGAALKRNGATLDLNTTKGRENAGAIAAAIKAATAHGQAVAEQTHDVNKGTAAFSSHIAQLRGVLLQSGLSRAEVDRLIATYGRVPQRVSTAMELKIAAAQKAAAQIRAAIGEVRGKTVSITVTKNGNIQAIQREIDSVTGKVVAIQVGLVGRGVRGFSKGGIVRGGTPGRDSVLALLTPGEYVETRDEADRLGRHGRRPTATAGAAPAAGEGTVRLHPDDLRVLAGLLSPSVHVDGVATRVDRQLGGRFAANIQ